MNFSRKVFVLILSLWFPSLLFSCSGPVSDGRQGRNGLNNVQDRNDDTAQVQCPADVLSKLLSKSEDRVRLAPLDLLFPGSVLPFDIPVFGHSDVMDVEDVAESVVYDDEGNALALLISDADELSPQILPKRLKGAISSIVFQDFGSPTKNVQDVIEFAAADKIVLSVCTIDQDILSLFENIKQKVFALHIQRECSADDVLTQVDSFPNITSIVAPSEMISSAVLSKMSKVDSVRSLHIGGVSHSKEVSFPLMPKLRKLTVASDSQSIDFLESVFNDCHLKSLNLSKHSLNSELVSKISQCSNLEELRLPARGLWLDGLSNIFTLPNLRSLEIDANDLTDENFEGIEQLKNLAFLRVHQSDFTGQTLAHMAKIPCIEELHIGGSDLATISLDPGIRFQNLQAFSASGTGLESTDLSILQGSAKLRSLTFGSGQLSQKAAERLSDLQSLESIHLLRMKLGARHLKFISQNKNIRLLELYYSRMLHGGLCSFTKASKLDFLGLGKSDIRDSDIFCVSKIKSLTTLDIKNTRISDKGVTHLTRLENLRALYLARTPVTDSSVGKLVEHLPLQSLDLAGTKVDGSFLCDANDSDAIVSLDLSGTKVSDQHHQCFAHLKKLREISLEDTNAGDKILERLENSPVLRSLHLRHTKIENTRIISHFENLHTLNLDYTSVDDEGLKAISRLRNLRVLSLLKTNVSSQGLVYFQGLPNLRELTLAFTKVDETCLRTLASLPNLRFLDLTCTKVSPRALDDFERVHKRIQVASGCNL